MRSLRRRVGDLRDASWQLRVFVERERRLLQRLATTIGVVRRDGQFQAWNNHLELVVAVTR